MLSCFTFQGLVKPKNAFVCGAYTTKRQKNCLKSIDRDVLVDSLRKWSREHTDALCSLTHHTQWFLVMSQRAWSSRTGAVPTKRWSHEYVNAKSFLSEHRYSGGCRSTQISGRIRNTWQTCKPLFCYFKYLIWYGLKIDDPILLRKMRKSERVKTPAFKSVITATTTIYRFQVFLANRS